MNVLENFIKLIEKETVHENESKKMTVLTRVLTLFLMCFLTFCVIYCAVVNIKYGVVINALFLLGFSLVMHMTYTSKKMFVIWAFNATTVIWIVTSLWLYGWFCGVQTFLVLLILLFYFASYTKLIQKMIFSVVVFLIYMSLYFLFINYEPATMLSVNARSVLRSVFMLTLIGSISIIAYLFSRDSQEMESKLVEYNKKLQEKASTDPLTGLYNRGKAMEILAGLERRSSEESFSLCICDIDFFKKVNDNYGHDIGDKVLKDVANTLTSKMDGVGYVARWGGEEFLLIFPGLNGDEAFEKVSSIQSKMRKLQVDTGSDIIGINLTYGLTEYASTHSLDENIKVADKQLYYGKDHGRDMIVY